MISIIVAMDKHGVIGKEGHMPWHCKEELQLFRQLTWEHTLVMGRTTFDSLDKQLQSRKIMVVTHTPIKNPLLQDVQVVENLSSLLQDFKPRTKRLFICGGASIYQQCLPYADELRISIMHKEYEGDTKFPLFPIKNYQIKEKIEFKEFTHYILHKNA